MQENPFDKKFMKEALKQANKAAAIGEVPIGCVIVYQDKIIARGYNRRNIENSTLAHAEITAIKKACKKLGGTVFLLDAAGHFTVHSRTQHRDKPSLRRDKTG